MIGWALILEYTIGGSAVARGISPNLVSGIAPSSGLFMGYIEQKFNFPISSYNLNENNSLFQALFFGGPDSLPWILARHELPWIDVVVDPCAAFLVFVVTGLLCVGIKEVSGFSSSMTYFMFFCQVMPCVNFALPFLHRAHSYKEL